MKKILVLICYILSLFSIAIALVLLRAIIDLLNPAACNNIWNMLTCPTLIAIPPYSNLITFASFGGAVLLSFVFYKLAKYLGK